MASLPSLSFGAKPPLTFDAFLSRCNGLISDRDLDIVRSARAPGFTRAPESHGCKLVDEWLSVQGSAPRRDPEKKGATAVKPWGST